MKVFLMILTALLFANIGLASATTTTLAPSQVISTLAEVESKIPVSLPAAASILIALLSELAMRVFPTKKPKSLLLLASVALGYLGSIFTKVSGLLDQVVQNIKEPEVVVVEKKK